MILLHGKGSDLTNQNAVQRRAKCKLITQTLMLALIDIAKERGAKDREKAYWLTWHCQNKVTTAGGRLYARQCKYRFCTYCNGVRKAELVHRYLPILLEWKDPHFLTLTVKAVPARKLKSTIKAMLRAFAIIKSRNSKRSQRGREEKLMGLKSLECNFNQKNKTYNPHFHLLLPSEEMARTLLYEWLALWTPKFTHPDAQDLRKVKDPEKDLIELIKYEAKIFTEPGGKKSKKGKGTGRAKIYARALDNIYAALKGVRVIDRFGFNAPKGMKQEKGESHLVEDALFYQYHTASRDWVCDEHESPLTNYNPSFELEQLSLNIDTESE